MENKRFEYEMVRIEIISLIEQRVNISIAMYTLCIAILGFAFELNNKYLFILIYVVLIPFQGLINIRRMYMAKCGAYLKVYFEYTDKMPRWEILGHESEDLFIERYMKKNFIEIMAYKISRSGTTIFSLLSIIAFCVKSLSIQDSIITIEKLDIALLFILILLFAVTFIMNRTALQTMKIYNQYELIFKELKNRKN